MSCCNRTPSCRGKDAVRMQWTVQDGRDAVQLPTVYVSAVAVQACQDAKREPCHKTCVKPHKSQPLRQRRKPNDPNVQTGLPQANRTDGTDVKTRRQDKTSESCLWLPCRRTQYISGNAKHPNTIHWSPWRTCMDKLPYSTFVSTCQPSRTTPSPCASPIVTLKFACGGQVHT